MFWSVCGTQAAKAAKGGESGNQRTRPEAGAAAEKICCGGRRGSDRGGLACGRGPTRVRHAPPPHARTSAEGVKRRGGVGTILSSGEAAGRGPPPVCPPPRRWSFPPGRIVPTPPRVLRPLQRSCVRVRAEGRKAVLPFDVGRSVPARPCRTDHGRAMERRGEGGIAGRAGGCQSRCGRGGKRHAARRAGTRRIEKSGATEPILR